jgi:hypothetical protein
VLDLKEVEECENWQKADEVVIRKNAKQKNRPFIKCNNLIFSIIDFKNHPAILMPNLIFDPKNLKFTVIP